MKLKKYMTITAVMLATVIGLLPPQTAAKAEEDVSSDTGIGGITWMLAAYYNNKPAEEGIYIDGEKLEAVHRIPSPYENLGIADVSSYVNVRSGPSTSHKVVGKLFDGAVANILEWDGDWVKIQSGNLEEGYVKASYLLTGWDAEEKIENSAETIITVTCDVLNVRAGKGTNYRILDKLPNGETYYVDEVYEDWVKIILSQDNNTGKEVTGYVAREYVKLSYEYKYAITVEEEKAELERLRRLEEEEKARQIAKLRQDIADFAVQFVGNPYVWGGTSLTKGADCSGFVQSVYKHFGYTIPRVSKDQAVSAGYMDVPLKKESLLPGDLIFYVNEHGIVHHVALYIGNGKVVHAATEKAGIKISNYTMLTPYKARRVVKDN